MVTQLLTIREFLTQFQGNEIVIALILFNWLILGGLGTLLARSVITRRLWKRNHDAAGMALFGSDVLFLPCKFSAIRKLRDIVFVHGSSVGFYPTWLFTFLIITPYCLLLGFCSALQPFCAPNRSSGLSGNPHLHYRQHRRYCGGALFSFALVYLVTPLQAIFFAHLPLLVATYFLFPVERRNSSDFYWPLHRFYSSSDPAFSGKGFLGASAG